MLQRLNHVWVILVLDLGCTFLEELDVFHERDQLLQIVVGTPVRRLFQNFNH